MFRRSRLFRAEALACFLSLSFPAAQAAPPRAKPPVKTIAPSKSVWSASWASSQLQPYGSESLPAGAFDIATLREIVHLSTGGARIRLHISNLFGNAPLVIASLHVAVRPAGAAHGAIDSATSRPALFHGQATASIPMGSEYITDPIKFAAQPLSDLAVTMEITHAPAVPTVHPGARATAFLQPGALGTAAEISGGLTVTRWYFLSAVDVDGPAPRQTVVAFGDSITDGHGSTTDGNDRWPDVLTRRLAANANVQGIAVVNEGIGGNRVLADGLGPDGLSRFSRDVLGIAGVGTVLVLEGINDIGSLDRLSVHTQADHDTLVEQLEEAFRQMVLEAHARGVRVIGCTLTPFLGADYYHPSEQTEADRRRLNDWILRAGTFDAVVDFDAAMRDPAMPGHLLPAYDSGDHLHPGPTGYKRMGELIPLSLFATDALHSPRP